MATYNASPHSEDLSPQPSTSQCPLEVRVIQVNPGPSAPRVDGSPPDTTTGAKKKRKRKQSVEEEGQEEITPGPKDIRLLEELDGLKMKLKKKREDTVLPEYHEAFTRLLKDPVIKGFLEWDKSLRLSDKYLLAMVVAYFSRAGLFHWQYQRIHFFLALYLAIDMEEDDAPTEAIFSFLYGDNNLSQRPLFHKLRFQILRSMGYRTWVSKEECEEIQAFDPGLWVWGRDRTLLFGNMEAEVPEPSRDASPQQEDNEEGDVTPEQEDTEGDVIPQQEDNEREVTPQHKDNEGDVTLQQEDNEEGDVTPQHKDNEEGDVTHEPEDNEEGDVTLQLEDNEEDLILQHEDNEEGNNDKQEEGKEEPPVTTLQRPETLQ